MDKGQQSQVNEAAEKFAESLTEAYRAVAGRSVSAQELNAQLTQEFFNGVINNLRTQAESNRAPARPPLAGGPSPSSGALSRAPWRRGAAVPSSSP